jgi:hypothetical protein
VLSIFTVGDWGRVAQMAAGGMLPQLAPRFACDSLRQAVVRAVAGFGMFVASADRLATLDRALGNRAPTHGVGLSQFGDELADTGWDFRRSGHIHILRHNMP